MATAPNYRCHIRHEYAGMNPYALCRLSDHCPRRPRRAVLGRAPLPALPEQRPAVCNAAVAAVVVRQCRDRNRQHAGRGRAADESQHRALSGPLHQPADDLHRHRRDGPRSRLSPGTAKDRDGRLLPARRVLHRATTCGCFRSRASTPRALPTPCGIRRTSPNTRPADPMPRLAPGDPFRRSRPSR